MNLKDSYKPFKGKPIIVVNPSVSMYLGMDTIHPAADAEVVELVPHIARPSYQTKVALRPSA